MTMKPLHVLCLLGLVLVTACAAQQTAPVASVPQEGTREALQKQPKGPEYVGTQLAVDLDGTFYLLWLAVEWRKSWDVLFSRSEDFGATWSQPVSLKPDKSTVAFGLRIAAGPKGNVYVVWREGDAQTKVRHIRFVGSQDRGAHWGESHELLGKSDDLGYPQLLADQDGGVYVAALIGPHYAHRSLTVAISRDFGATFLSAPVRLSAAFPDSPNGIMNFRVESDGQEGLYAVWEERPMGAVESRIYLHRSSDGGRTWTAQPVLLSAPAEEYHLAHMPQIVAVPKGRVYVVWKQDVHRSGDQQPESTKQWDRVIYFNRSLDYGQTWPAGPVRLNEAGARHDDSAMPGLSADQHGHVYAVWLEPERVNAGSSQLFFTRSTDFGTTWSAPMARLNHGSALNGAIVSPIVRDDGKGHVWVVWQEKVVNPNQWSVLMNRSEDYGGSWGARITALTGLPPRRGTFREVSFLGDMQGHLAVAWNGDPPIEPISVNRSIDFGATWLSREVLVGQR